MFSKHGGRSGRGKACKQRIVRRATVLTSSSYNSVSNFHWGVECFIEEVTMVVELSLECGDKAF